MARTIHKRKRSDGGPFKRVSKRRRIRRTRFTKGAFATSSRSVSASNAFKPRSRKLKRSTWRRMLWRDTLQMAHYRTVKSNSQALTTPNDVLSVAYTVFSALNSATDNEFWKTAGGMQDPSFGVTPDWAKAAASGGFDPIGIVLRGGRLWCTVACTDGDSLTVRVQLIFAKQQSRNTTDTAVSNTFDDWVTAIVAAGSRPKGWDLTVTPDYESYMFKPVLDKTIQLQQGQTVTNYFKIKPTKIDVMPFKVGGGWYPWWVVYAGQDMNVVGAGATPVVTFGHNMSFSVTDYPK